MHSEKAYCFLLHRQLFNSGSCSMLLLVGNNLVGSQFISHLSNCLDFVQVSITATSMTWQELVHQELVHQALNGIYQSSFVCLDSWYQNIFIVVPLNFISDTHGVSALGEKMATFLIVYACTEV